ncbi:MAG: protein-L-isoaspartate(D-aspartate) O-methyltransferase [Pseudomonadota bacterium]
MNLFRYLFIPLSLIVLCSCTEGPNLAEKREAMIKEQLIWRDITDSKIIEAMKNVPREEFVPTRYKSRAYDDVEVPIGWGETNNRPYEDALVSMSLEISPDNKVLEIGTGSGLQASIISKLAKHVYTIEIMPEIAKYADDNIKRVGIKNISIKVGDGFYGWPEFAPFDVIFMSASPPQIPKELIDQLSDDGRLLAPVGGNEKFQTWSLYKKKDGKLIKIRDLAPTTFIPMKGKILEK